MTDRESKLPKGSIALPPAEMSPEAPPPEGDSPEDQPKKPKKKKLTKEQKKERKRQREIAAKKMEMQIEFQRELELSRKMAKRLKADWEISLREMKLIELKQELMVWEQKAMSQLNEKEEKIQDLLDFINFQEEMNLAVAAQLRDIFKYITDVCNALTDSSKILYEEAASEVVYDFHKELNEHHDHDKALRLHCESVMHTTNVFFEHGFLQDYDIFVERRNDNINTEIQKRYCLRDGIVNKMKASRQQLLSFIEELTSTQLDPKKYERIRQLMNRQQIFVIQSEHLTTLTNKKRLTHSNLQRELLQFEMKSQKKINDLRLEQSYFFEIRRSLLRRLKLDDVVTLEKEKVVCRESYAVIKHFKEIARYGELLISTATNIRKFQTEAEKVISWKDLEPTENTTETDELRKFMLTVLNPKKLLNRDEKELYFEMNSMRVFWRRVAIVETQNAFLKKEKLELLAENKKYTDFIRKLNNKAKPGILSDKILVRKIEPDMPYRY